ncbi:7-cyano-7-deazaguanine synthase QueC [Parvularcula sp. ZS-1/3]|uniref:7-cyano-7-deazaguanine synthase n=1 Tax=Parvularcula mediterranea TaxID=2732508 RepID=A0A7Y3RKY2_9PROT|nr:7-cyano-7-deazaguanine synthase QueC [Parvularcula mediterranea]NNU15431.1 7-cyano-7-deazaguanine synthase QueC [Parvularcula mediterranea]
MTDDRKALVLFSGGQDSATCLAFALARYPSVETIGFTYGQRHAVEMEQRLKVREAMAEAFPAWRERLGEDHVVDLGFLSALGETAMTADVEIKMTEAGLPSTFVPGRNLAFLVAAGALAYRRGVGTLVGGMCETDYSGYPDCRQDAVSAQTKALSLGMDQSFRLETPLMHLTKEESWALADRLGGEALTAIIEEHTHTCYLGERGVRHDWGYGCGTCPACELRAEGHRNWKAA